MYWVVISMEFINKLEPDVSKPLIIAAMQDMGNVGSIVVNFINKHLRTTPFRYVKSTRPPFVYDKGGYIEIPEEKWEYRYGNDLIIFGGGAGQPQQSDELNDLCQDVINVAKSILQNSSIRLGVTIQVDNLESIQLRTLLLLPKNS